MISRKCRVEKMSIIRVDVRREEIALSSEVGSQKLVTRLIKRNVSATFYWKKVSCFCIGCLKSIEYMHLHAGVHENSALEISLASRSEL